ncbi:hypothetical protein [Actinoplanes sp. L3-i22]|uniref:hypothetical protein n=1 Tax=Actinoplanes sp. L3-i22 TaxID=2836373 RepID=UPI001C77A781|nr:hypothetical protein [Actinoplanes sp. L3-i22]BCY10967.1 hypothetical protein L3i22_060550 [Actinoplanes sp. L3-i22]
MISGIEPLAGSHPDVAAANMIAFAAEVRARAEAEGEIRGNTASVGEPVRDEAADQDGWFGWTLPVNGRDQRVLMPGLDLAAVRSTASTAARVQVNDSPWWWNDAAGMAVPLPDHQPWLDGGPARGRSEMA